MINDKKTKFSQTQDLTQGLSIFYDVRKHNESHLVSWELHARITLAVW